MIFFRVFSSLLMHHTCKLLLTRSRASKQPLCAILFSRFCWFDLCHTHFAACIYRVFVKPILMSLHGCLNVSSSGFRWAPLPDRITHITLCTQRLQRDSRGAQPNPLDNPFPSFYFLCVSVLFSYSSRCWLEVFLSFVWIIALKEACLSRGTFHTQCPRMSCFLFKKIFFYLIAQLLL